MATECRQDSFDFGTAAGRSVVGAFDGGVISSDAGALLLGAADKAIGLVRRFAGCFRDGRKPELIEHKLETLVGQRVAGIALGYEDLIDHDELRHDPVMAVLAGKLEAQRKDCAPVAGKSTLSRLEHAPAEGPAFAPARYHKIGHDTRAIEELFVTLFLEAHERPPGCIVIDLDATDDPLHGHQEGGFFHGYYDCYCYLPLYIFCGRHLLAAKLRRANIDASAGAREEVARIVAQIRARWPKTEIWLRADSGFAREELMAWCEENSVHYVLGLARNNRLVAKIGRELKPEIFNTDQGSQFTGAAFTGLLAEKGIRISMDGKGAWRDNVFVERLWRTIKYEEVYLHAYESVSAARAGIGRYLDLYNRRRPHSGLVGMTPDQAYFGNESTPPIRLAA